MNEDDPILRDYRRIAGERTAEEITRSLLSEHGLSETPAPLRFFVRDASEVSDEDRAYPTVNSETTIMPIFAHIYNADGTCHAANCGAPGLILAYDDFSPEIAQWFCGMHWSDCRGKELLTVAEDRRKPIASFFGGTYEVRESSPGVFTHTWAAPPLYKTAVLELFDRGVARMREQGASPDMLIVSPYIAEHWEEINHRIQSEAARSRQRRAAQQRAQQRLRKRTRRKHRAAFRRRKRGLA
jgi:hypothetical protein